MLLQRLFSTLALIIAIVSLPGRGASRAPVQGNITLDGQPVESGSISFVPLDRSSTLVAASGDITGGTYSLGKEQGPFPGEYRVEIYYNKKTGKKIPVPGDSTVMTDEVKQLAPAKYNTESTLKATVAKGENKFDFALDSK